MQTQQFDKIMEILIIRQSKLVLHQQRLRYLRFIRYKTFPNQYNIKLNMEDELSQTLRSKHETENPTGEKNISLFFKFIAKNRINSPIMSFQGAVARNSSGMYQA